jgi:hypothetical protein
MVLLAGFLAYYNWRLTSNPFLIPHVLNTDTYGGSEAFLWQSLKPPLHYDNAQFEGFFNGWVRAYYHKSWADAARLTKEKFIMLGAYFFSRPEWLLLPFVPFLFRDKRIRLLLASLAVGISSILVVIWGHPHYAAPLVGVVFGLVVQTMRHLNTVEVGGRRLGAIAVRCIVVITFSVTLDRALGHHLDVDERRTPEIIERAVLTDELKNTAGKHLVIVRYHKDHDFHMEWVYNGADIDSAKILWARELDAAQNERLFAYFKDRQIWLIQPDERNRVIHQLKPYPGAKAQPLQQAGLQH